MKYVALVMYSEWHEGGIEYAIGPFDTELEADNAIPRYGYVVELRTP